MARTLRNRKNGKRVYEIRIFRGRDPITGKQLKPYTKTWPVPDSYSDQRADKEAAKVEALFEKRCKDGLELTKEEKRQRDKEEAEALAKAKLEYEKSPTVESYVEYFKNEQITGRAPSTRYNYNKVLRNYLCKTMGNLRMTEVTSGMIRKVVDEWMKKNKYDTVIWSIKVLGSFFRLAKLEGVIEKNPMDEVIRPKRPKRDMKDEEKKALAGEEIDRFLAAADKEPMNIRVLLYFLIDTGCRIGEATGLMWDKVNLDDVNNATAMIDNNRVYSPDRGYYETSPKNGRCRIVSISRVCAEMMKEWKTEQRKEHFLKGEVVNYVFENKRGGHLNRNVAENYVRDMARKSGLEGLHPHKLRHTMVSESLLSGVDIVTVSEMAGHSSPAITARIYAHSNEEAKRRATEKLAESLYNRNKKTKNA